MAVDMFIKLEGIKGESVDHKHKDEIDVLAWSWGMSQSGTTHQGPGAGSGKVNVQDLSLTKYVDKASANLMKFCCKGTHIKEAVLTVRKAGDKPLEYVIITMKDAIISSLSTGGSGGEDRLTENVTLNFAHVKTAYTPQKADGSGEAAIEMTWNIATNTE
jgi:type VI secretion system secreted protein Hcp